MTVRRLHPGWALGLAWASTLVHMLAGLDAIVDVTGTALSLTIVLAFAAHWHGTAWFEAARRLLRERYAARAGDSASSLSASSAGVACRDSELTPLAAARDAGRRVAWHGALLRAGGRSQQQKTGKGWPQIHGK